MVKPDKDFCTYCFWGLDDYLGKKHEAFCFGWSLGHCLRDKSKLPQSIVQSTRAQRLYPRTAPRFDLKIRERLCQGQIY